MPVANSQGTEASDSAGWDKDQERKTHPAAATEMTAFDQSIREPRMPLKCRISNTHETVMNRLYFLMLYPFIFDF